MFSHTIFNGDVRSNDHTGSNPAALTNPGWWILWQSKFTCWVKYTIVSKCTQHRRHIWVNNCQLSVIQRPKWIECQFRDKYLSRCFGVLYFPVENTNTLPEQPQIHYCMSLCDVASLLVVRHIHTAVIPLNRWLALKCKTLTTNL